MQLRNIYGEKFYAAGQKEPKEVLQQWTKGTGDSQCENLTLDWYNRQTIEALEERETEV